ncbi:hypothetical protein GCM10022377_23620 [Zhihengliuella alba]|uniref:Uncharacterized protein n=1 Tax=Zhihengliuella alba TaxID=547018 RepID=A0ABP7DR92_9MICC
MSSGPGGQDGGAGAAERFTERLLWIHALAYVPQLFVPWFAGTDAWVALVYLAMLVPVLAPAAAVRAAGSSGYRRGPGLWTVAVASMVLAVLAAVLLFMLGSLTVQLAVPLALWAALLRRRLLVIGAAVALVALLLPFGGGGTTPDGSGVASSAAVLGLAGGAVPPLALCVLAGLQCRLNRSGVPSRPRP